MSSLRRRSSLALGVALAAVFALARPVAAAHPMLTEDTGTQGRGRVELELGLERDRDGGSHTVLFAPQVSYGIVQTVDFIVQPSWLRVSGAASVAGGAGDTVVDAKWRFVEQDDLSLGVRGGVGFPTGNADRGLGAGEATYHLTLIASLATEPLAWHANVGGARQGGADGLRRDLASASIALVWTLRDGLQFTAEIGVGQHPDRSVSTWPAVARCGLIATVDPHLDLDVGVQTRLNDVAPESSILAGATLRW
jgi:hypothetical protein